MNSHFSRKNPLQIYTLKSWKHSLNVEIMNENGMLNTIQLITEFSFQFVFSFSSFVPFSHLLSSISTHTSKHSNANTKNEHEQKTNKWFGIKGCYLIQWHTDSSALTELNSQIILCGLALLLLPLFFISAIFKVSTATYLLDVSFRLLSEFIYKTNQIKSRQVKSHHQCIQVKLSDCYITVSEYPSRFESLWLQF